MTKVLENFSQSSLIGHRPTPVSFKKKMGKLISSIPFGRWIIQKNRQIARGRKLGKALTTQEDFKQMKNIELVLKQYAETN